MRTTRIIGIAAGVAAALCPAAAASAGEPGPIDVPGTQLPGGEVPGAQPEALGPPACTYVVESDLYTCDPGMSGRLAAATTVVASLYPAKGFLGAPTLTIRSEKGGCTAGKHRTELRVDLRYLYFTGATHWDDEVMSFRTYAGCRLKLYDGTDGREGRMPATGWLDDHASMTKLDGRAWARRADLIAVS